MALILVMAVNCLGARLSPAAERAYEIYVANVEARLARQHAPPETYLTAPNGEIGHQNRLERQLMSGDIRVEAVNGGTWQVASALLHHWRGAAFVSNATPKDMLAILRDFNHFPSYYSPQVVSARALKDNGETATLALRFREQRMFTIVLDGEYKIETRLSGDDRGYSASRSLHLWQIDSPGTPHERRRPEGQDEGLLWHLNTYWSFTRIRGGLQMECEAVSLTRDIPPGLGWLITPIVRDLPRESLEFTLRATKRALDGNAAQEAN
jgi:hypothetical protein